MFDVFVSPCASYEEAAVENTVDGLFKAFPILTEMGAGKTVVIKTNLVIGAPAEKAATTHPALLLALSRRLLHQRAHVILGDSPGGLYNRVMLDRIYAGAGLEKLEKAGVELNRDFSVREGTLSWDGRQIPFSYTGYLDKADYLINFCKLKAHGMMGMSCAVKNMFGAIPGTAKPEYHYRFPNHREFAAMLVSLCGFFHPTLSVADGVVAMEGNGPTMGSPRSVGLVLASENPFLLDAVCARLIGQGPGSVPTLQESITRKLVPESWEAVSVSQPIEPWIAKDFDVPSGQSTAFFTSGGGVFGKLLGKSVAALLSTRPALGNEPCRGCGKCAQVCPARAIALKDGKPEIDRKKCIRCFCCQEFCPFGAMVTKTGLYARLLHRK